MNYEAIPIQTFITQRYQTPGVQQLVDAWRIEPSKVIEKIIEHFREMGIYQVPAGQERLIMRSMLHHLRTSPDLIRLVARAQNDELKRQRNRHAE